jgi:hypothetical protein
MLPQLKHDGKAELNKRKQKFLTFFTYETMDRSICNDFNSGLTIEVISKSIHTTTKHVLTATAEKVDYILDSPTVEVVNYVATIVDDKFIKDETISKSPLSFIIRIIHDGKLVYSPLLRDARHLI